jgi:hypothetical protein
MFEYRERGKNPFSGGGGAGLDRYVDTPALALKLSKIILGKASVLLKKRNNVLFSTGKRNSRQPIPLPVPYFCDAISRIYCMKRFLIR